MPETIYANSNDGAIGTALNSTFHVTRRSTSGGVLQTTRNKSTLTNAFYSSRGGGTYGIYRGFFRFDTSGISVAPTAGTLSIFGWGFNASATLIGVKSEHGDTLAVGDFDAIVNGSTPLNASNGSGGGTFSGTSVVDYTTVTSSWSLSAYNDMPLTAAALSDMASLSNFKVCVMEHTYDYSDITNGTTAYANGCYYIEQTGTSLDPKLVFTPGTAVTDNATFFGTNF